MASPPSAQRPPTAHFSPSSPRPPPTSLAPRIHGFKLPPLAYKGRRNPASPHPPRPRDEEKGRRRGDEAVRHADDGDAAGADVVHRGETGVDVPSLRVEEEEDARLFPDDYSDLFAGSLAASFWTWRG